MKCKRFFAALLALLLLCGTLAACQKPQPAPGTPPDDPDKYGDPSNPGGDKVITTLPEGMSGSEAARLILASERLNAQLLKDSDNIFVAGGAALESLAAKAKENLAKNTYAGSAELMALSTLMPLSTKADAGDGSYVEIDGNVYRWKGFQESSNSYSYFENLTTNVVTSAERGADLIDSVKKHVRVVDRWVKTDLGELYLHVEENEELLFSRFQGQIDACRRYKNEKGANVYEIYYQNEIGASRMIYIPGEKCEYSFQPHDGGNHDFLAENTKGFWEVVDVGKAETHYNVSCMVLKNDICYDAFYNPAPDAQYVNMIKVISADKKTDLLWYDPTPGMVASAVTLHLQGFEGVAYTEFTDTTGNGIYTDHHENISLYGVREDGTVLVTANGTRLKGGDILLDGKVEVRSVITHQFWLTDENYRPIGGYAPSVDLLIHADGKDEVFALVQEFLDIAGLRCARDFDYVLSGIDQALLELSQFTQYHQWNESPIRDHDTLAKGFANRQAKYDAWAAEYDAIKDGEVLDMTGGEDMTLYMSFSPVTTGTGAAVSVNELVVSISDLALTATDTMLFVDDEPYVLSFALLGLEGTDGTLTLLESAGEMTATPYVDADTFTVKGGATLQLPTLAFGSYTLVAYISTADGIRSSAYIPVPVTELVPYENASGNVSVSTAKAADGTLLLTLTEVLDVEISAHLPEQGFHSYATMYDLLAEAAYLYGFAEEDALVELLGEDGTWAALLGTEEKLGSGTYRLRYSVKNGEAVKNGTVFTVYTAPVMEPTPEETPDVTPEENPEQPADPTIPENPEGGSG
ncbi:MAG: hypothetical protein E7644_02840 [Ruminococcaceae bacterium]|nr:hypothetical protein [Oscillospiraceae bacterium]